MAVLRNVTTSNSVMGVLLRTLSPMNFQPEARTASRRRWASKWVAIWASVRTASKRLTRSAELTTCLAEGADELDGAGVDHGDVHDGVARGVLHGDGDGAVEEELEFLLELLPGGVGAFAAGEGVELAGLDAMDELARLAFGGDEVEPAAGDEAVLVEAEDAIGDGVAVVVVVKEPAVEVVLAQGGLNGGEIHVHYLSFRGGGAPCANRCRRAVSAGAAKAHLIGRGFIQGEFMTTAPRFAAQHRVALGGSEKEPFSAKTVPLTSSGGATRDGGGGDHRIGNCCAEDAVDDGGGWAAGAAYA